MMGGKGRTTMLPRIELDLAIAVTFSAVDQLHDVSIGNGDTVRERFQPASDVAQDRRSSEHVASAKKQHPFTIDQSTRLVPRVIYAGVWLGKPMGVLAETAQHIDRAIARASVGDDPLDIAVGLTSDRFRGSS